MKNLCKNFFDIGQFKNASKSMGFKITIACFLAVFSIAGNAHAGCTDIIPYQGGGPTFKVVMGTTPRLPSPWLDLALPAVPFQENPYLYKIHLRPNERGVSKSFYLWLTQHDIPIEATLPRIKLEKLLSKCAFVVGELGDGENINPAKHESELLEKIKDRRFLKRYSILFDEEAKDALVKRLYEQFKGEKEEFHKSLMDTLKEKEIHTYNFEQKHKAEIEERCREYEESIKRGVSNWFGVLPKRSQEIIQKYLGKLGCDWNEIHPATLYYLFHFNKITCPKSYERGIDSMLDEKFILSGGSCSDILGLETYEERWNHGAFERVKEEVERTTPFLWEYFIGYLKELEYYLKQQTDKTFEWDESTISYHKGAVPLEKSSDESIALRDAVWVPRYLEIIENFKAQRDKKRFLMYVGIAHGYSFFKNVQDSGLVERMERYSPTRGWQGFAFSS